MSQVSHPLDKSALAQALRNYLPSALERQCLHGEELGESNLCARHLAALLRTISTYIPRLVVVPLLANPQAGQVEGGFHGTVMFSDISGFTAMSEKLSQLGKEGAEEVAAIVNRFFAALLEVTNRHDGDLLKFGGDALLVFFGGEDHELRACLAALQMQATMSTFSSTRKPAGPFVSHDRCGTMSTTDRYLTLTRGEHANSRSKRSLLLREREKIQALPRTGGPGRAG